MFASSVTAAAFFLLVAPLASMLKHHEYAYLTPEVGLLLLGFAAAAIGIGAIARRWPRTVVPILASLVALFFDVQIGRLRSSPQILLVGVAAGVLLWPLRLHAARIVAAMAATMLVSTAVLPRVAGATPRPASAVSGRTDLPLMIHVLLDEHGALSGLPPVPGASELESEAHLFFRDNRFLLFDRAYSEFFNSVRSISHLMNFTTGRHDGSLYSDGTDGFEWNLTRNAYFGLLQNLGYSVRVYQSDYLNLCAGDARIACTTYMATDLDAVQEAPLSPLSKAHVVISVYLSRSDLYVDTRDAYRRVRGRLAREGVHLPAWSWERDRFTPLASMPTARQLIGDLSRARRGDYYFAHLLMPHWPYVYDARCALLPARQWLAREAPEAIRAINTAESRMERYARYVQQTRCVYRQLRAMLASIPPAVLQDAIVVIQGDHGSRITRDDPIASRAAAMSPADYADGFATLFAVRAPGLDAGTSSRQASIACILSTLVRGRYSSLSGLDGCANRSIVFMLNADGGSVPAPLPPFDSPRAGRRVSP